MYTKSLIIIVITDMNNHIYMMPGLAASSLVFENIRLENTNYQLYRLDWIQPKKNEKNKEYLYSNSYW